MMFRTLIKGLKIAFKVNKAFVIVTVLISILNSLADLASFYMLKLILDTIVKAISEGSGNSHQISYLIINYLVIFTATWILRNINTHIKEYLSFVHAPKIVDHLDNTIIKKLDKIPTSTLEDSKFHDKFINIQTFSKEKFVSNINQIGNLVQSLTNFIYSIILIVSNNWIIAVIVLGASAIEVLYQTQVAKRFKDLHDQIAVDRRIKKYYSDFTQDINNYFTMKSYSLFPFFLEKIKIKQQQIINHLSQFHNKFKIKAVVAGTIGNVAGRFLPIGYYANLAASGEISLGSFQLYYSLINQFYTNTFVFYATFNTIYENSIYLKDLFDFLEMPEEKTSKKEIKDSNISIEFQNVSFKYPFSDKYALTNVSFKLQPGNQLAIVGHNGAGKTTILKLLSKFYLPTKGKILVNGADLKEVNTESWRRKLAYMNQEVLKIFMTAEENVSLGDVSLAEPDEERIDDAMRSAEIWNSIQKLPEKEKTMLGKFFKGGVDLSVGQWQKISLARNFYRDAPIIILDEPTASIDTESENKIFQNIFDEENKKTFIIVSHRFSNISRADKILVLKEGEIIEKGNHEKLMKLDGEYATKFRMQKE